MILMSVFIWLPKVIVRLIGIMGIRFHPMPMSFLVSVKVISQDLLFLLSGGGQQIMSAGSTTYIVSYAVLPWTEVMAFGYALAEWIYEEPKKLHKYFFGQAL